VRAYLQISCAGLGFDIGELWWTSNSDGGSSSALAAIEEKKDTSGVSTDNPEKKLRFVQLYTSKSYENRRPMLIRPAEEEEHDNSHIDGSASEDVSSDLEKHVLSPTLVDAISKTAQVVWAHTKKTEGLTGRSDIRLQTAVGMPVAVDRDGNMCVVVMFSPNNIQSTDNALEYLQSISRSATSSSIPCLLPAFDPRQGLISLQHHHHPMEEALPQLANILTDGVVTRFVSLDENTPDSNQARSIPEVHSDHDLESAPRDCFGIPMLPAVAELGNPRKGITQNDTINDAFDEASYGVWSTIMQTLDETDSTLLSEQQEAESALNGDGIQLHTAMNDQIMYTSNKPFMDIDRQERLEEFASAFLDVSIFDLAEVWAPTGLNSDSLALISSVKSIDNNTPLDIFARESKNIPIKFWSGAVGRAHSSGNPVWSFNIDVFSDPGRANLFQQTKFETVLAIPVFSGKSKIPAFVFSCYSFVRSGSIPFVLKFVQQALKLLWGGLDKVAPHESVNEDVWNHVAPADLGEMAADVEMHQHFMVKKRPIGSISAELESEDEAVKSLSLQVDSLLESGSAAPILPSIYIGQGEVETPPRQYIQRQTFEGIQSQLHDAVQSVATMQPVHQHISTNSDGSKRAHVFVQAQRPAIAQQQLPVQEGQYEVTDGNAHGVIPAISTPLPLPQPFRLPNQLVQSLNNEYSPSPSNETPIIYQHQPWQQQTQQNPTYISPNNQSVGNIVNTNNSQPLPLIQQQQQEQSQYQEQEVLPTPVYSIAMDSFGSVPTTSSAPSAPLVPQNASVHVITHGVSPTNAVASKPPSRSSNKSVKPCRIQGCDEPALTRRPYCVRHSGSRMCEHKGCTKCAQGSTRFCIAHGGGRRCTFPGCDKGARDKFFCAAHGGGKRCKYGGCSKSAVGGSSLCTSHGGGRRCAVEGCDKSAQSSTKFCVKHGGGKKCSYTGCEKVSRGRTNFCAAHGGGVRCKLAGCNRVAIGKVQLCRAHGGGARPKHNALKAYSGSREIEIPMASSVGGIPGRGDGTFCVPIIEPVMDAGFDGHGGDDNVDLVDL
jgi:hypothetical protein